MKDFEEARKRRKDAKRLADGSDFESENYVDEYPFPVDFSDDEK